MCPEVNRLESGVDKHCTLPERTLRWAKEGNEEGLVV